MCEHPIATFREYSSLATASNLQLNVIPSQQISGKFNIYCHLHFWRTLYQSIRYPSQWWSCKIHISLLFRNFVSQRNVSLSLTSWKPWFQINYIVCFFHLFIYHWIMHCILFSSVTFLFNFCLLSCFLNVYPRHILWHRKLLRYF